MRHDGKAEFRRTNGGDLTPVMAGIFGPEHAVMVLAPYDFGMRGAARQPMHILYKRLLALLRRHVFVVHAAVDDPPRGALVGTRPHAGGRYADPDVGRIARIDQHRIDARLLAAGDAHPLPALSHAPQRLVQRP